MSLLAINTVRWFFYHSGWDLEEARALLTKYRSVINVKMFSNDTPLHFVLKQDNCSAAMVRLLLRLGADTTITDEQHRTPMEIALKYKRDEETLWKLVYWRALVSDNNPPYFCLAVHHQAPMSIIDKIIRSEMGLNPCQIRSHESSLFKCAMSHPHPQRTVTILKSLLHAGFSIKSKPELLCFALSTGNDTNTIKFLLENGVLSSPDSNTLNCREHPCFWMCLSSTRGTGSFLDAELAKILLGLHPIDPIHEIYSTLYRPIQLVLQRCRYDFEAIKLILDSVRDADLNSFSDLVDASLLHYATANRMVAVNSLLSVIGLLIERGVNVRQVNTYKHSALDDAVLNSCKEPVLRLLLEKGCNLQPQMVLVSKCDKHILKLIMATGIILGKKRHQQMLKRVCTYINASPTLIIYFQYLLRYYILHYADHDMPFLFKNHHHFLKILEYRDRCVKEVAQLKSMKVDQISAFDLIGRQSSLRGVVTKVESKVSDFDLLLQAVSGISLPLYRHIIVDKVGRPVMKLKIFEMRVYTAKLNEYEVRVGDVVLNSDCVEHLVRYLEDADLFYFIMAYFKSDANVSAPSKASPKKRPANSDAGPSKLLKTET